MADLIFNINPGSSREEAHRVAINGVMGAPIESFRYATDTGLIRVTTREIPAFGILDKESEESKLVQRLIKDYRAQDAVLFSRTAEADKREADILRGERKLVFDSNANAAKIIVDNKAAKALRVAKRNASEGLSRQREQELDRVEGDLRQRETDLATEREAFEREKKGLPPLTIREKVQFVLGMKR